MLLTQKESHACADSFVADTLEHCEGCSISKPDLLRLFVNWCGHQQEHKLMPWPHNYLKPAIKRIGGYAHDNQYHFVKLKENQ